MIKTLVILNDALITENVLLKVQGVVDIDQGLIHLFDQTLWLVVLLIGSGEIRMIDKVVVASLYDLGDGPSQLNCLMKGRTIREVIMNMVTTGRPRRGLV